MENSLPYIKKNANKIIARHLGEDLYKLLPSLLSDPLIFTVVHVCMYVSSCK